ARAPRSGTHARRQPVPPRVGELLLITAEAFEVRRGDAIAQLGEACRLPAEAVLQRYEVAVAGRRRVPDGGGPAEDSGLVEHRDTQARLAHDGTPGRRQTAVDQPEERRLTGAVPRCTLRAGGSAGTGASRRPSRAGKPCTPGAAAPKPPAPPGPRDSGAGVPPGGRPSPASTTAAPR